MDALQKSFGVIMFIILASFLFLCLLTIYCISRQAGLNFPDIPTPEQPSTAAAPAASGKSGGRGLDSSAIKALPIVSYNGAAKQLNTAAADSECPICLSEFDEEETVKFIPPCRHVFHPECLDTWLSSHVSCPVCRGTHFFEVADV